METLVGLLGVLIAAYLTANYAEKNERRVQLQALAAFLEGIADCLQRMEESLSNNVVPTADGHMLEQIVGKFADVVQGAPLDSQWKQKAELLRRQLEVHMHSGQIIDDIIRGYVLREPPDVKAKLLHSMVRTSGELRGQAVNLRVHAK